MNDADNLANAIQSLSNAIIPTTAAPAQDAAGIHIASLTEALMGVTAGLFALAEAIKEHEPK